MKSVAIIGAGPSGLVAAKTLLRSKHGQYNVSIFEKTNEIGGLWAVSKDNPYHGMLNPEMPTNLSRFNIGFSDLAWSSVDLEGHVNYWPRAWQVNQYLKHYVKRYIPPDGFRFNTKVTFADVEGTGSEVRWRLKWLPAEQARPNDVEEGVFDHLVIATGLFSASSMPSFPEAAAAGVKVVHSTKLRKLADVAPDDKTISGTILVVGGGMSGGDASTVLATQLSSAAHSPSNNARKDASLDLIQLCPDAAYALPLAAPSDKTQPHAPEFLPLDLCMYKLDTRPPGPIEVRVGKSSTEMIEMVHTVFQGIVGNQTDLKVPGLSYDNRLRAPYVTLTEQYAGFVRSGDIQIAMGRLERLQRSEMPDRVQAVIKNGERSSVIDNVVGIVYATGFTPQPALDFLGPELKKILSHDTSHNRLPIVLDECGTISHSFPSLAVIGFHEGAFWGSMEMEARLVEHHWSKHSATVPAEINGHSSQGEQLLDLRIAMNNKEGNIPQYWLGDYVGLLETIAREIGLKRNDLGWQERTGPVTIARYTDSTSDQDEADKTLLEFLDVLEKSRTKALFASRASFLGLQGHWHLNRTITSLLDSMPSGTMTGTASFLPRLPTDPAYDFEYLYTEHGTFKTTINNLTMQASRQYVYRYQESTDTITVWFVKTDGSKAVDYMYHSLTFDARLSNRERGWMAKADHLCVKDMYRSDYCFTFEGANLSGVSVDHAVKGPKKDYVSESKYTR